MKRQFTTRLAWFRPAAPDAAAVALGATEPPSLDRDDDDVVDDIDRVFGAPPAGESAAAVASQPISTQRVAESQPGLIDQRPENHPVFMIEDAGAEATALDRLPFVDPRGHVVGHPPDGHRGRLEEGGVHLGSRGTDETGGSLVVHRAQSKN